MIGTVAVQLLRHRTVLIIFLSSRRQLVVSAQTSVGAMGTTMFFSEGGGVGGLHTEIGGVAADRKETLVLYELFAC